jgi:hydrogenase maturation factor
VRIEDRLLFLKYALPCAGWYVYIGTMKQERLDELVSMVSEKKVPEEDVEGIFKVAKFFCVMDAREKGKSGVDSETIRNYFQFKHNKQVEEAEAKVKDGTPQIDSRTYAGKVIAVGDGSARVRTLLKGNEKEYKTSFQKDTMEGDLVVVHYNFIVEKISEDAAKRMTEFAKGGGTKTKTKVS